MQKHSLNLAAAARCYWRPFTPSRPPQCPTPTPHHRRHTLQRRRWLNNLSQSQTLTSACLKCKKKTNPLKTLSKNTNVQHEHVKKPHKQKHKSFAVLSANLYFPPHINVVGSDINGCYVLRCAVFYFLSTSSTFDESILIRSCFSWRLRMLNVVGFL